MAIFSLAIAIKDEADLASGHKRKKQGDIIAVCPDGWQWGTEEVKRYLIVRVDFGSTITLLKDAKKLAVPRFSDGSLWDTTGNKTVTEKRRYSIPMSDLVAKAATLGVTVDMAKVIDPSIEYQPVRTTTIPYAAMVQDKVLNKKIASSDITKIRAAG